MKKEKIYPKSITHSVAFWQDTWVGTSALVPFAVNGDKAIWPVLQRLLHCKKRFAVFPVPSRDVTYQNSPWPGIIKLKIIKLFPARESLLCDIPAGEWKPRTFSHNVDGSYLDSHWIRSRQLSGCNLCIHLLSQAPVTMRSWSMSTDQTWSSWPVRVSTSLRLFLCTPTRCLALVPESGNFGWIAQILLYKANWCLVLVPVSRNLRFKLNNWISKMLKKSSAIATKKLCWCLGIFKPKSGLRIYAGFRISKTVGIRLNPFDEKKLKAKISWNSRFKEHSWLGILKFIEARIELFPVVDLHAPVQETHDHLQHFFFVQYNTSDSFYFLYISRIRTRIRLKEGNSSNHEKYFVTAVYLFEAPPFSNFGLGVVKQFCRIITQHPQNCFWKRNKKFERKYNWFFFY